MRSLTVQENDIGHQLAKSFGTHSQTDTDPVTFI